MQNISVAAKALESATRYVNYAWKIKRFLNIMLVENEK
jgi:hypothetical protein